MLSGSSETIGAENSFCVALFESLYGARPFPGSGVEAIRASVLRGEVVVPDRASRGPLVLRRVIARGLRSAPAERWPDMESLLAALRARSTRRRRALVGAAAVAFAAGVAAYGGALLDRPRPCQNAAEKLESTWSTQRAATVRAGIVGIELAYASSVWERVRAHVDGYADAWRLHYREVCEATAVHHAQSDELLDARMACLEARRQELDAMLTVLERPDAESVQQAVQAVNKLTPSSECVSAARRGSIDELSDVDEGRAAALRERSALAGAYARTGQFDRAHELLATLPAEARSLGAEQLALSLTVELGALQDQRGRREEARELLRPVIFELERREMWEVAFEAAEALAHDAGCARHELDEASIWEDHAETLLRRLGRYGAHSDHAMLLRMRGVVQLCHARRVEARALLEEALALTERLDDDTRMIQGPILNSLANASFHLGEYKRAIELYTRATELDRSVVGEQHPTYAGALTNLANVLTRVGEHEEAQRYQRRAIAIFEATVGPAHEYVSYALEGLGTSYLLQGRHERALDAYERARRIVAAAHPDSSMVASLENNIGEALVNLERAGEALPRFQRALDIWSATLGDTNPELSFPLTGMGEAQLALGDAAAARASLARARTLQRPGEGQAEEHARTAFGLARAMWQDGEHTEETIGLARAALKTLRDGGGHHESLADAITTWIELRARTPGS